MANSGDTLSPRERVFWLQRRQALLIELASIEEFLELPRSFRPRHQRAADARRCAAEPGGAGEGGEGLVSA